MATERRVTRLRDLVDQIERLPVSPDRDRLLSEVRSRTVDVETGVTPRAVLPLREPTPPPVERRPPQPDTTASIPRMASPPPAPAVEFARPAPAASRSKTLEEPLWTAVRLSLEDTLQPSPLPYVRARGARAVPPWTLGLRG